jgi:alpha-beta hydrolase superfamily lysophospholipase
VSYLLQPDNYHSFYYDAKDNKKIHAYVWNKTDKPKGVVQILHGMAEHAVRYADFAAFLNKNGFIVYANDHRGHGKTAESPDEIGIIGQDGFELIISDAYVLLQTIKNKHPGLPVFILGHSFGSFLAQSFISRYDSEIDGVILSGSAKQDGPDVAFGRVAASIQRIIFGENKKSFLIDKLGFGSYNKRIPGAKSKFAWLSCDDSEVEKYENDPLCGNVFSIGFYYYFFNALKGLYDFDKLSGIPEALPIFIVSGEEDPVGRYGKKVLELYDFYKKIGLLNVQIKLYRGKRHEILNETDRQVVYDDILSWLETQLQAQ